MKETLKVKCDRCGRIRELFEYTHFDTKPKTMQVRKDNGVDANPRFTVENMYHNESRGLCEECAVYLNIRRYDNKITF